MKRLRTPNAGDTTSEPPGGNARMGAPITASMSDGASRNQGGTVEYFCIPPLIRQGMGLFFAHPDGMVVNSEE